MDNVPCCIWSDKPFVAKYYATARCYVYSDFNDMTYSRKSFVFSHNTDTIAKKEKEAHQKMFKPGFKDYDPSATQWFLV